MSLKLGRPQCPAVQDHCRYPGSGAVLRPRLEDIQPGARGFAFARADHSLDPLEPTPEDNQRGGDFSTARERLLVVGHVPERFVEAVLEFDLHSSPMLDIEGRRRPIDADLCANRLRLLGREVRARSHDASSVVYVHGVIPGLGRLRGAINSVLPAILQVRRAGTR